MTFSGTALEFAKSGKYKVYATMRNPKDWLLPAQENIVVLPMDVTSDTSVNSAIDSIIKSEGNIDIIVNNAGYGVVGVLEAVTIDEAKVLSFQIFDKLE